MTFQIRPALLLLAASLLTVSSCQTQKDKNHEEVLRISAEHDRYQAEWAAEKQRFLSENPTPEQLDFGIKGTLIVREAELAGLLGSEKLRVKYTFVNTTGVPMKSAELRLMLIDTQSELEWGEVMDLRLPFGFELSHNSSYSGLLEIPLEGLHRRAGWSWRIEITAADRVVPSGVKPR